MTCDAINTNDFLRTGAEIPFQEHFVAAGIVCKLATNAASILAAARQTFLPIAVRPADADIDLRFWVDASLTSGPPWPKPYFRGLDHLVYAGFDGENSLLMDLRGRRAIGRFSPAMAEDYQYWDTVIFPSLMSVLGVASGVVGLHCGCVVRDGNGILLCGGSGSGKSTLAFAMAQGGFSFLSDDWTYFHRRNGQLRAWGLTKRLKLLTEATQFFPELNTFRPVTAVNGERAYELDVDSVGLTRARHCEPRWVVFLERNPDARIGLLRVSSPEATRRLAEDVLPEPPGMPGPDLSVIESLAARSCRRLRFSGPPWVVCNAIADACGGSD